MKLLISTSNQAEYQKAKKAIDAQFDKPIDETLKALKAAKRTAAKGRKAFEKEVADAEAALKSKQEALAKYDAKSGVVKLQTKLDSLQKRYRDKIFTLRNKHRLR